MYTCKRSTKHMEIAKIIYKFKPKLGQISLSYIDDGQNRMKPIYVPTMAFSHKTLNYEPISDPLLGPFKFLAFTNT